MLDNRNRTIHDITLPAQPPKLRPPWTTREREDILATARDFSYSQVLPTANRVDRTEQAIPPELIDQLADRGYFGITIPTEYGGLGLGVFEYAMISEELSRSWMSVASIIARGQGLGTRFKDPGRRTELTRRSAAGRWIGAAAFSEPESGSDLGSVQTTARREGNRYIIDGRKRWCGNAFEGDFILVMCRVVESSGQPGPIRTFVLDKERNSFPVGVTGEPIDKIGYHGIISWDLTFTGVVASENSMVEPFGFAGAQGMGFKAVEDGLNIARVQTAARAVGLARAALEDSVDYLQSRVQFGSPLGQFQALRFTIAEMAAKVSQARAFYQHVAHLMDCGVACEQEAAMTKLLATEMAVEVTGQALQLHGGNGYTRDLAIERYWRDARLTTIFEGTSQIQQKIISDRILPREKRG
ncbi:acyl-CoA dehydrogenase family protein [Rhodococcus sp. LB1]|uniref:acyl-CoA dehydrogenase family protein n=1 Tax=Rhodococcus sp. LB1 TaxID=1807499 RepID=UPI00077AFFA3|nr:acyl-CoA dehydrogenase family protein [Rhodococcus sp. LB1]KXX59545.1 acyl-CoA dehydrogenase [Rhodococcus sp. LB1]